MHRPLYSLNLSNSKIEKLYAAGYYYVNDVDLSEEKCKINIDAEETSVAKSALDIYQEESVMGGIITLNRKLDESLRGSFSAGKITELCGGPGSGKTQLCFQLCINVQLPVWCGGMAGEALYISTNKGFAVHRLKEMAKATVDHFNKFLGSTLVNFYVDSIMKNIHFVSVEDHIMLTKVIKYLENWLQRHSTVRLIIIDSICAPLKLLSGRERTVLIYNIFKDLQMLARTYNFTIVVTNDMTTRLHSHNLTYHTASLGDSYYHRINSRVELTNKSPNIFIARILKCSFATPTVTEFSLIA